MAMGSLDMTAVTLIPDQLIMTQGADMPIFRITDWNLGPKTFKTGKNGLRMVVVMKRKITSEMMTTYFPTMIADIYISTSMETFEHRKYKTRGENGNN